MRSLLFVFIALFGLFANAQMRSHNGINMHSKLPFKKAEMRKMYGFDSKQAIFANANETVIINVVDGMSKANNLLPILKDAGSIVIGGIDSMKIGGTEFKYGFGQKNGYYLTKLVGFIEDQLVVIVAVSKDIERGGYLAGYTAGVANVRF